MAIIPIHAPVECRDGKCGESVTLIVNPISKRVTHVVVRSDTLVNPRMVPVEQIQQSSSKQIELHCSMSELEAFPQFSELHFIGNNEPMPENEVHPDEEPFLPFPGNYTSFISPYVLPVETTAITVEEEHVPVGERAIHRGAEVEAVDGQYVGKVKEFVVDPKGEYISHIVVEAGRLWNRKEIVIPITAIQKTTENGAHLSLNKQQIEQLPSIGLRRFFSGKSQADQRIESSVQQSPTDEA